MGGGPKWKLQSEARWEDATSAFQEEDGAMREGLRGKKVTADWREDHKQMQSMREESI